MDESRGWAAPVGAVVLGAVAAVGLGAWAVVTPDAAGRLLVGLAAVGIALAAVVGALARPRLAARADGLTLRGPLGTRTWPWARVDAVRVVRLRRLGMPAAYVEVEARDDDGGERLLVLGRLELGADPRDVAEALQSHRARAGRSAGAAGPEGVADDRPEGEVTEPDEDEERDDDDPGEHEPRRRA